MRTKIITLGLFILALFSIPSYSQENKEEKKQPDRRMIQHVPMMRNQHQMTDMKKMGAMMDTSMTQCDMMMQHMKQLNVQDIMGGQMGKNSMMGTTQGLKNIAEQMKSITQNMDNMMANKEMMSNIEKAERIKEMHIMLEKTTKNLVQMTDLNQKIMSTMHKQPVGK